MVTTIFAIWFVVSLTINLLGVIRHSPAIILTIITLPIIPFIGAYNIYKEGKKKLGVFIFTSWVFIYSLLTLYNISES
jgi:hypothetical protein